MAYTASQLHNYVYPAVGIGAGTVTKYIQGPKGKSGRLIDILATPSTAMVGTTTVGKVQVGTSGTLNAYGDLFLGTTSTPSPVNVPVLASQVTKVGTAAAIKGQDPNVLPFTYIPADTVIYITFVAPTGSPAGVIDANIAIEWFD